VREYILELDRPRKLKFGFKAIRLIREHFGEKDVSDLLNMKVDEMPIIAWAGLIHEDPNLTIEKVEDLLDGSIPERYTVVEIVNILVKALEDHFGISEKKTTSSKKKKRSPESSGSQKKSLKN